MALSTLNSRCGGVALDGDSCPPQNLAMVSPSLRVDLTLTTTMMPGEGPGHGSGDDRGCHSYATALTNLGIALRAMGQVRGSHSRVTGRCRHLPPSQGSAQ